jgi:hypothetical protein
MAPSSRTTMCPRPSVQSAHQEKIRFELDCDRGERATIVIDQIILDALEHYPFSYIRELARFTCIPITTVHRHLTQSLGFVVKHLRWISHTLTHTQKPERATLSIELLRQLRSIEQHSWQFIFTLTSHGSIFRQTMNRSGFAQKNNPLKGLRHKILPHYY